MICPTCTDAVENKCCQCGKRIVKAKQKLTPHPFYLEMSNCRDLHLLCNKCYGDACGDI